MVMPMGAMTIQPGEERRPQRRKRAGAAASYMGGTQGRSHWSLRFPSARWFPRRAASGQGPARRGLEGRGSGGFARRRRNSGRAEAGIVHHQRYSPAATRPRSGSKDALQQIGGHGLGGDAVMGGVGQCLLDNRADDGAGSFGLNRDRGWRPAGRRAGQAARGSRRRWRSGPGHPCAGGAFRPIRVTRRRAVGLDRRR